MGKTVSAVTYLLALGLVPIQAIGSPISGDGVIYSDFGPGGSYQPLLGGRSIGEPFPPALDPGGIYRASLAMSFSVPNFIGATAQPLGQIALPAALVRGQNAIDLQLLGSVEKDFGGTFAPYPGSVIETYHFRGALDRSGANTLLTANSVVHPALQPGATYWLLASDPDPNGLVVWKGSTNTFGPIASSIGGAPFTTQSLLESAFELTAVGTPATVPEPGMLTIVGGGAVFVLAWVRRRKSAA